MRKFPNMKFADLQYAIHMYTVYSTKQLMRPYFHKGVINTLYNNSFIVQVTIFIIQEAAHVDHQPLS